MSESRAQRTLVKSHPELWSELSDPAALARHLGEFGEIRITRLEPETRVVWEGEAVSGTVELAASGWGTKVTLTATLEDQPAPADGDQPAPADGVQPAPADGVQPAPADGVQPAPEESAAGGAEAPEPSSAECSEPESDPDAREVEPWGEWRVREWPAAGEAEPSVPWYRRELEALAAAKAAQMQSVMDDSPADEPSVYVDGNGYGVQEWPRPRRRLLSRFFRRRRSHSDAGAVESVEGAGYFPGDALPPRDEFPQQASFPAGGIPDEAQPWAMSGEGPPPDPLEPLAEPEDPDGEIQGGELKPGLLRGGGVAPAATGPGPMPPAPGPDPSPPSPGPDPAPPVPRPDPVPPSPAPDPQPGPPEPVPPQIAVDAVLTAVLDDLGSAHHRPFSR